MSSRTFSRLIDVVEPERLASPVIFASPHSGREYPLEFLDEARLDRHALRQSEDCYVDLIFDAAPRFGAPLLRALFPRAYVDVNRGRAELDPRMFADSLPRSVDSRSSRVLAGLGVIPRIVADGKDIYAKKLRYEQAQARLQRCYDPYHEALAGLIDNAVEVFGCAIVIDCHSMPSIGGAPQHPGGRMVDFVLGDRFGSSCAPMVTQVAEATIRGLGYEVTRNAPYAGGYVAASYGRPRKSVHVLQIEINRALYLDERKIARQASAFERLRSDMRQLIEAMAVLGIDDLWAAQAAQ